MEQLGGILESKRKVATRYRDFFAASDIQFKWEPVGAVSNFWLNSIVLNSREEREEFLRYTNDHGVMTRPAWELLSKGAIYSGCMAGNLDNAGFLEDRIVNLPSSPL
jgi:dTDP-4-amino-4,6-dideoxygalactose transaminase